MTTWRYYVYEVTRDDSVIYVGKGSGERMYISARYRGGKPRMVACFEYEEGAFAFERERIQQRLDEGCDLLNVMHGYRTAWLRRKDSRQMAREVLQQMARRVGNWLRAGRLHELSAICRMPVTELCALHQRFGR